MTVPNSNRPPKPFFAAVVVFLLFSAFIVAGVCFRIQEDSRLLERRRKEYCLEAISKVLSGDRSVYIYEAELIPMLSANAVCLDRVDDISIVNITLNHEAAYQIAAFRGLRKLGFYSCRGAEGVIKACVELPIEELYIETTPLSDESLLLLPEFKSLRLVHFEQVIDSRQYALLKALPSSTTVKVPFLVDATGSHQRQVQN